VVPILFINVKNLQLLYLKESEMDKTRFRKSDNPSVILSQFEMIDLISIRLELIADKETSRLGPHQRFPAVSRKESDKILIVHALWHHMEFHFQRWCDVIQVIVIWITVKVYNVKLKILKWN